MQQSNALQRLEKVLSEAIKKGDKNKTSGPILLAAMNLPAKPYNLINFYELLKKADEETKRMENTRVIEPTDGYLKIIRALNQHFVTNSAWSAQWASSVAYIESKNVLPILKLLARFSHQHNPQILLEKDFLNDLSREFSDLLEQVEQSDLSRDIKIFLMNQIETIQTAIRRYQIDGTEGLIQAIKSFIGDLSTNEHKFSDEEKNKKAYQRVRSWGLSLLFYLIPTPYDLIGIWPTISNFPPPGIEELRTRQEEVEQLICNIPNISEASKEVVGLFDRQSPKQITGMKEQPALPPSKESQDVEDQ